MDDGVYEKSDESHQKLIEGNCLMPGCLEFGGSKCENCDTDLCWQHLESHECEVCITHLLPGMNSNIYLA